MAEQAGKTEFVKYSMERNKRGIAVIIGVGTFESDNNVNRPGMIKHNINNCQTAFDKLHFKIELCPETTANGILTFLQDFSKMNHDDYDCFVLYFSSHGGRGYLCCSDCIDGSKTDERRDGFIYISTLVEMFLPSICKSLDGKPKLFFFDGCRHNNQNIPTNENEPIELVSEENTAMSEYADIFISYATIIGGGSHGPVDETEGNAYTNNLTTCLQAFGQTKSFSEVMNQVNHLMKKDERYLISEQQSTLCGSIEMKYLPEPKERWSWCTFL